VLVHPASAVIGREHPKPRDLGLCVGAGDENLTRTISLGRSAGSAVPSIAAGRAVSSPVRECPPDALVARSIGHAAGTPTAPEAVGGQLRELPNEALDQSCGPLVDHEAYLRAG
jgi:hypothetical protein